MKIPSTPKEFIEAIDNSGMAWSVQHFKGVPSKFWVSQRSGERAYVSYTHKKLWVNLRYDKHYLYDFPLSRIREDWPQWSWSRQVGEKNWHEWEHMELLHALESMFHPDRGGEK